MRSVLAAVTLSIPVIAQLDPGLYADGERYLSVWREARTRTAGFVDYTTGRFGSLRQLDSTLVDRLERVELAVDEVEFASDQRAFTAQLVMPPGEGPHPAMVLLGAPTRLTGLTERFAAEGIATLRITSRRTISDDEPPGDTWQVGAHDYVAATDYVRGLDPVDPKRVGIWARERPARMATIAASRSEHIAFLVLIAHPAVSDAAMTLQSRIVRSGLEPAEAAAVHRLQRLAQRFATTGEGWPALQAARTEARDRPWLSWFGIPPERDSREWAAWRGGPHSDPLAGFPSIDASVLALFGEFDHTLDVPANIAKMKAALDNGRSKHATVRSIAGAARGFEATESPDPRAARGATRFAEGFFDVQLSWLRAHVLR